ncbi:unnamed protein product [Adineta steineri]|uniref:Uncharacterized protein n=1 Tax=Adineta steineri TaxID=433720 RepID=A0A814K0P1_9BILA|nr:unnamed protein product [Adineta steineri]CAF1045138.1 unnamed protein product [Adineta steineri]
MKGWVICLVSTLGCSAMIIAITGSIVFGVQRHKEMNFVENICLVIDAEAILHGCGESMCYAPVWTVEYNDNIIIKRSNQTIARITGSNSSKYAKALNELEMHPVSIIK